MNPLPVFLAACVLFLALAPVWANADAIFKCMGGDGKVFYQSTKCEEEQEGEQLVIKQAIEAPHINNPGASPANIKISQRSFNSQGSLEGVPVLLLILPSVDVVLIPASFANKIGIECESHLPMDNQICKSVVRSMKIGNIFLANVPVTIVPSNRVPTVMVGQLFLDSRNITEAQKMQMSDPRMMGR